MENRRIEIGWGDADEKLNSNGTLRGVTKGVFKISKRKGIATL